MKNIMTKNNIKELYPKYYFEVYFETLINTTKNIEIDK